MKCYLLVDQTVDTQQPTPRISPFYAVFRTLNCPADFDSDGQLISVRNSVVPQKETIKWYLFGSNTHITQHISNVGRLQ